MWLVGFHGKHDLQKSIVSVRNLLHVYLFKFSHKYFLWYVQICASCDVDYSAFISKSRSLYKFRTLCVLLKLVYLILYISTLSVANLLQKFMFPYDKNTKQVLF